VRKSCLNQTIVDLAAACSGFQQKRSMADVSACTNMCTDKASTSWRLLSAVITLRTHDAVQRHRT